MTRAFDLLNLDKYSGVYFTEKGGARREERGEEFNIIVASDFAPAFTPCTQAPKCTEMWVPSNCLCSQGASLGVQHLTAPRLISVIKFIFFFFQNSP